MLSDFVLASGHHVAVFLLLVVLSIELTMAMGEMDARAVRRLAAVDNWYGYAAGAVVAVGVARVIWGAKDYQYYLGNSVFWLKMALFVTTALLSILPTLHYVSWRNSAQVDPNYMPAQLELTRVRRVLSLELFLFLMIPIVAAALARGYGF
jgi:putative membrane protein